MCLSCYVNLFTTANSLSVILFRIFVLQTGPREMPLMEFTASLNPAGVFILLVFVLFGDQGSKATWGGGNGGSGFR